MNKASILSRKASFRPVEEEVLAVLKNINPLYVVTPLLSDRSTSFAIQFEIARFLAVITRFSIP